MTAKILIQDWREVDKGALKAGFSAYIENWKLYIRDMAYFEKDGKRWVNMPSRKYEADGETKYFNYVRFEKEVQERFNQAVLDAIGDQIKKEPQQADMLGEEEIVPF